MVGTLTGLGCAGNAGCNCGGNTSMVHGLGTITRADIEKFFIGPDLYTRSTIKVGVYNNPGEDAAKWINANDVIGKVVALNSAGNWAKLDNGQWISLAPSIVDHYYTTELSKYVAPTVKEVAKDVVEYDKSIINKAVDAIPFLPSADTLKLILWAALAVGGAIIITRVWPRQSHAMAGVKKKQ